MPFGFGRKKETAAAVIEATPPGAGSAQRAVRFHGFTEDWRLEGQMRITGRMLDTLNRRDAIPISDVRWAPAAGGTELEPAPGIKAMDPYDLIVVIAGPDTLMAQTDDERSAHRIHKVTFEVAIEAPPFKVIGTIQLHPGSEPESLLERGTHMFTAITDPVVQLGGVGIDLGNANAVLVNRFYIRGVTQVDLSTGEPHVPMPGFTPI